ncbi:hypothetical protein [Rhizobium sp. 9140]|nr:hypothetical protein [Rhizobium sp. 9140]
MSTLIRFASASEAFFQNSPVDTAVAVMAASTHLPMPALPSMVTLRPTR